MPRTAKLERKTRETEISAFVDLDGSGKTAIQTGVAFFDHMLELLFKHALIDLSLKASGDLEVDAHHTVEDVGLVLGKALSDALGEKKGIERFGFSLVPMDECLAEVALDLSGRPFLFYEVNIKSELIANFDPSLAEDFFKALADEAKLTLHVSLRRGGSIHHSLEAVFKATGRALKQAISLNPRVNDVPSTKGII